MFEMQTQEEILKRLLETFNTYNADNVNTIEGSFAFDTLSANSVEFEKAYAEMALMIQAFFPQTSWGEYLTMLAEQQGVIRRSATNAIVTLNVTGTVNASIPIGALFSTADGLNFITNRSYIIGKDGMAFVEAISQSAGAKYNVEAGKIIKIPVSIYGISSVTNESDAHDGYDEESDKDLLERYLFKVRNPATSGNENHYILWATSISGVGKVKIKKRWAGNGTVKVIITDVNNKPASSELIQKVVDYIEKERPIGPTITVVTQKEKTVNITLSVTKGVGVSEGIKQVVNDYFNKESFYIGQISLTQIGRIILDNKEITGVEDYGYNTLKINGSSENITLTDEELAVVGTVTINA